MARPRISRGTPQVLTVAEQEAFVRELDQDPEFARAVATNLGVALDSLTYQQKVAAVSAYVQRGFAAAPIAAATRAIRDVKLLAAEARGEVALADRVTMLEAEVQRQTERAERAEEALRQYRAQAVAEQATPAMAVHS